MTSPSYAALTDLDEIRERFATMTAELKPIGLDTETGYHGESREEAALHAEENFVVSVQFTNSLDWARMVPLAFQAGENVDNKAFAPLLWALLHVTDAEGLPLAVPHGAVAELRWLARFFLRNLWDHPLFGKQVIAARGYFPVRSCSLLEIYAEGENRWLGLKAATLDNFGHKMLELADLLAALLGRPPTEKEKKSVRFSVFNPKDPDVIAYACEDAVMALRHHLHRFDKVRTTPGRKFIYKVEMNVLPIVCQMADDGVAYDWNLLRAKASEVHDFADRLLAEVIEDFEKLAGEKLPPTFNLNSSKQFADLLYNKCKMPVLHTTDSGAPSVDAKKALPGLAARYPEVQKYLSWKKLHDLRLKFLEIYELKYSWAADGRAHPLLNQHGTITGRTACEHPNVQQSPGMYKYELRDGTRFEFNFRDAIVAAGPGSRPWWTLVLEEAGCPDFTAPEEHGWYIFGFDYSQIELRVMAAEAGETSLLEAFHAGVDVHTLTASRMEGIPMSAVTKEIRKDKGKRMNFAVGYGLTEAGMAQQTGKPIEECRELFAAFHKAYPRLKPHSRMVIRESRRLGYVITKFGRKVRIWEYDSPSRKVQASGERTAGNCVIQGPATGEYVKIAMVRAVKALDKAGLSDRVRLIMNIHDALEFEVRDDVTPEQVAAVLKPAVLFPVKGPGVEWPPLVADWHMGPSWGQLEEMTIMDDGRVVRTKDLPPAPEPESQPEPVVPDATIVEPAQMPTRDQVKAFAAFARSVPGDRPVELRLPDGQSVRAGFTCGLGPEHEAALAEIFGMATVLRTDRAAPLAAV